MNAVYDKNIIQATPLLSKCQEPVKCETTESSSIEFITILFNQRKVSGFFDVLIGCLNIGI